MISQDKTSDYKGQETNVASEATGKRSNRLRRPSIPATWRE